MRSLESLLTALLALEIADRTSEKPRRERFTLDRLLVDAGLPTARVASLLGKNPARRAAFGSRQWLQAGNMSDLNDTNRKLDLIVALMRIGFGDQLQRHRHRLFDEDPASEAILRHADDWIAAGALKGHVTKTTKQSEPTVKRRIADLVSLGALERRGAGSSVSYRSTGLFEV